VLGSRALAATTLSLVVLALVLGGALPPAGARATIETRAVTKTPVALPAAPAAAPVTPGSGPTPGPIWENLSPGIPNPPPCGGDQALAYDPLLSEFVLFGGVIPCSGPGFATNATWAFSNGAWSNLTPTLPLAPSARYGMGMAFDPAAGCLLAFGGGSSTGVPYGDTWTFNGTWTNITSQLTASPYAEFNGPMTYDPAMGAVVLVDGLGNYGIDVNGTWAFADGAWSEVRSSVSPSSVRSAALSYDAATGSLLLFGGYSTDIGVGPILNTTWSLSNGQWAELTPSRAPPPVYDPSSVYDPVDGAMIVYGGYTEPPGSWGSVGGTWAFANGTWTNWSAELGNASPGTVGSARLAWNSNDSYALLFGGRGGPDAALLEATWAFVPVPINLMVQPALVRVGTPVTLTTTIPIVPGRTVEYTYSGLPTGCTTEDGPVLACTPTTAGTWPLSVNASGPYGPALSTTANLTVAPPLVVTLSATSPGIDLGQAVSFQLQVTHAVGGVTVTYTGLPDGCSPPGPYNWSCTPTALGNFSVSAGVQDSLGNATSNTVTFEIHPTLTASLPASGYTLTVGTPFSVGAVIAGGSPPYTLAWTGLPSGCSTSGTTVTCTPLTEGTYAVRLNVTDQAHAQVTVSATFQVNAVAPVPSSSSGGAPIWIWYVVGIAVVLVAGAAVFALVRRRAPPPAPESDEPPPDDAETYGAP
jgi:hypothetical protein